MVWLNSRKCIRQIRNGNPIVFTGKSDNIKEQIAGFDTASGVNRLSRKGFSVNNVPWCRQPGRSAQRRMEMEPYPGHFGTVRYPEIEGPGLTGGRMHLLQSLPPQPLPSGTVPLRQRSAGVCSADTARR